MVHLKSWEMQGEKQRGEHTTLGDSWADGLCARITQDKHVKLNAWINEINNELSQSSFNLFSTKSVTLLSVILEENVKLKLSECKVNIPKPPTPPLS